MGDQLLEAMTPEAHREGAVRVKVEYSLAGFNTFLRRLRGRTQRGAALLVQKVALDALYRIILRNPVRTGRSRAAWTLYPEAAGVPSPAPTIPAGVTAAEASAGQAEGRALGRYREMLSGPRPFVEIVNGVWYVVGLEYGMSRQAPQGMVRVSLAEIRAALAAPGLALTR